MIQLLKKAVVNKNSVIRELHDVTRYVPSTEPWNAFEIAQADIDEVCVVELMLSTEFTTKKVTGVTINGALVAATCDWNDILFCVTPLDEVPVAKMEAFGYADMVYRVKYIAAPARGYWDGLGNPILINKKKALK